LTRPDGRGNVAAIGGIAKGWIMSGWARILVFALAFMPAGNSAIAANWVEENFYLFGPRYDGVLPPCDAQNALGKITARFNDKEHTYWSSALTITGYENIHEVAFRPWAANSIPRRFCTGVVHISDGSRRQLHYSIGEDTGIIGASWGVEWCVVGLDRNWAYNPSCKMAQP
jgi:hypothetical protein